jgi:microcystin-dependent protein
MSEPFVAEIRIFAGNFAPLGWAFCNGQLLPISQNTALFSLIGTTYGGDGRTTTALPNMQGRAPMHPGRGPGLTNRLPGERLGVETVTLTEAQMPHHAHTEIAQDVPAGSSVATNSSFAEILIGDGVYAPGSTTPDSTMDNKMISHTGGSQAHNNMQPYLAINFIIALVGLYPSRS